MSFPLGRIEFVARIVFAALPTIVQSSDVRYDIPKMHSERPLLMSSDWLPTLLCSSSKCPYTKSAVIPDDNSQYLFIGQTYYHWLPGGDCLCYSQQLYLKDERAATGDARL